MGLEARSARSGESMERRATVELEARSGRSGESKERRATVGLEARSVRGGEGNERRVVGVEARSERSGKGKERMAAQEGVAWERALVRAALVRAAASPILTPPALQLRRWGPNAGSGERPWRQ